MKNAPRRSSKRARVGRWIASLLLAVGALPGCRRAITIGGDSPPASLIVREVESKEQSDAIFKTWAVTCAEAPSAPAFRFQLRLPPDQKEFVFTTARFLREERPAPDCLRIIGAALGAAEIPSPAEELPELSVDAAILGRNLSRGTGETILAGGFTSDRPGDWIAVKVFVAGGEGEFYVNVNPVQGVGEIASKDPEYTDIVVSELSKVLGTRAEIAPAR
jgi:hypothetical protein